MKPTSARRTIPIAVVALALTAAAMVWAPSAGAKDAPCTSTVLRPGAQLPDITIDHALLRDDHVVWHDPQTGEFVLAFSGGVENLGAGRFNAVGERDAIRGPDLPSPNVMPAFQRVYHSDGTCDQIRIGTMTYHPIHHHWHYDGFMDYQLLDAAGTVVKPNNKVAFCLADVDVVDDSLPGHPKAPLYNACDPSPRSNFVSMGVSVGWEDIYDKQLVGQNFDVTDLMSRPAQEYILRATVDPGATVYESDRSNNSTEIRVTLGIGVPYSTGGPRPGV